MSFFLSQFRRLDYTQSCVARGIVSWGSKDDATGELQLWCRDNRGMDEYYIYASMPAGDDRAVCKVIDVFTLHFQKCSDKINTLWTKKSKFHFVQYLKQIVPCRSTDKGVSSRGSRVRTKLCGSIIDSESERVLINIYHLTIILNPFYLKKSLFMCLWSHLNVSVVVNFLSQVMFCFSFVWVWYNRTIMSCINICQLSWHKRIIKITWDKKINYNIYYFICFVLH